MLKKFLEEVISTVAGKSAVGIVDLLHTNKHVNEFLISKKLDLTINQTRNILYKISDYGLVSSMRKKDKKKGWYTYFWKIEVLKSLEFLKGILLKQIAQISNQIKSRETKEFYICERCNIEFNQETALLYDFTCNECGGIFSLKDNTKILKELNKNLKNMQEQLKFVDEEIGKEKAKEEKSKLKEPEKKSKARSESKTKKAKLYSAKKYSEKTSKKNLNKILKLTGKKSEKKKKPKFSHKKKNKKRR